MQPPKKFKHGLINIFEKLVLGLFVEEGKRGIRKSIKTIIIIQLSNDGD